MRGTVTDVDMKRKMFKCGKEVINGTFFDDSACRELKKRIPLYSVFDYDFLSTGEKFATKVR